MVENIDIGGPTDAPAAAKNADGGVTTLIDPADYPAVCESLAKRRMVPLKTVAHTRKSVSLRCAI